MHSATTIHTSTTDAGLAIAELKAAFAGKQLDALLFFCSTEYDMPVLAAALQHSFGDVPCVAGCTTSGHLGQGGFERGGLSAIGFSGGDVVVTPFLIDRLSGGLTECEEVGRAVAARRRCHGERGAFGLLLVDGLSQAEEQLTASLHAALGDLPVIGGSAGDDLAFRETLLYLDGAFRSDRAIFLLFETANPFATFRFQHFVATEHRLVATGVERERRVIVSFNGLPAVDAYAEHLGLRREEITARIWSQHPLLVSIGGETYIRSIQSVGDDGSLTLFCAVEEGVVVRVGTSVDPLETADKAISAARGRVPKPIVVLGCDCILRRLEFEETGIADEMGALLARQGVFGFSTYGEQWNSVHVNQTFTGVVLGGRHAA